MGTSDDEVDTGTAAETDVEPAVSSDPPDEAAVTPLCLPPSEVAPADDRRTRFHQVRPGAHRRGPAPVPHPRRPHALAGALVAAVLIVLVPWVYIQITRGAGPSGQPVGATPSALTAVPASQTSGCGGRRTAISDVDWSVAFVRICVPPAVGERYWVVTAFQAAEARDWTYYPTGPVIVGSPEPEIGVAFVRPSLAPPSPAAPTCDKCRGDTLIGVIVVVPDSTSALLSTAFAARAPLPVPITSVEEVSERYLIY